MPVNILNLAGLNVLDFKETATDYHVRATPAVISRLAVRAVVRQRALTRRERKKVFPAQYLLRLANIPFRPRRKTFGTLRDF